MPGTAITADFFPRTRNAKKVMVLDFGFLGDAVHLLPALWMVRQAYPQSELHVALATHAAPLMEVAPWINRTWGYMRFPRHATLRENLQLVAALRREKFDVLINLNGSERSSWLTFLSGARERLGRMPAEKVPLSWRLRFTAGVFHPFLTESLSLQRCRCLEKAGFPFIAPEFHVEISQAHLDAAKIVQTDVGNYFHISPFTTADHKELPPAQLAEFIVALSKVFHDKKLVLTCAPTERERNKMTALLATLPPKPWRVFPGNLTILQLAAVIKYSAASFSGDTGTMHLAAMAGTPFVAWFWPNPGRVEWLPARGNFRVLTGENGPDSPYLLKVRTDELIRATQSVLADAHKTFYPAA